MCSPNFDRVTVVILSAINRPDGNRWEWYVKHGDTDQLVNTVVSSSTGSSAGCCG